jgi:hypothetical protein
VPAKLRFFPQATKSPQALRKRKITLIASSVISLEQKMRIYAKKVNGDGNKARCSSEEAH